MLAREYHTECEAYDRKVCTGPITRDGILPANGREASLINENAVRVRDRLLCVAASAGVSREMLLRAIALHWPTDGAP